MVNAGPAALRSQAFCKSCKVSREHSVAQGTVILYGRLSLIRLAPATSASPGSASTDGLHCGSRQTVAIDSSGVLKGRLSLQFFSDTPQPHGQLGIVNLFGQPLA